MIRIFRYILQVDTGMAPCIDNCIVSLATCKPKIRSSARAGDWVMGFRPSPAPRGLLVWAARVAYYMEVGHYERCFRGRSDAIYRAKSRGGFQRLRPDYHPGEEEFRKDTSSPVLLFDEAATWYFGAEPHLLPDHLMHLRAAGRGHRVNGVNDEDASALESWLNGVTPAGVHGLPRNSASEQDAPLPSRGLRSRRCHQC